MRTDSVYTWFHNNRGYRHTSSTLRTVEGSSYLKADRTGIVHKAIEIEVRKSVDAGLPDSHRTAISLSLKTTYTRAALPADPTGDMDYWGAEKTSSRIAEMASSLADLWRANNPDKNKEEFQKFLDKLTASVEKGFSEAQKILDGVINGPVQELIRDTYDKTMAKITRCFEEKMKSFGESEQDQG